MRITCLGAARTVTGSCYLVEKDEDTCFLVDCGMFQGGRMLESRNWQSEARRPSEIQAIFISHAHIDHSGLVPRLVRQGYSGPIYATKATCELLKILWLDAAHIQEMEAEWQSRKNRRRGKKEVDPLYETADAEQAATLLRPVELNQDREMIPGVHACYVTAGHILGAASLRITLSGPQGQHRIGFSGDLGRPGQLIVPDPEQLPDLDTVFMETTYGNRTHKSLEESQAELLEVIRTTYDEGGKVLIPAFAVERTQDLIYTMAEAYRRGEMPKDMPVYLDSPLAIRATEIFRDHPEFFDAEARGLKDRGKTPLNFPTLQFSLTTDQSRAINENKGPAVIMAGNGMATAGRIKHHLKHNIWKSNTHLVLVGFQAQGTTGRRLIEGAETIRIFREEYQVKAHIHTIGGFSAHADQSELLAWLKAVAHPGLKVNLVHGEESQSLAFKKLLQEELPKIKVHVPKMNETIQLAPALAKPSLPQAELAARLAQAQERMAALAQRVAQAGDELSPRQAAAVETELAALERLIAAGEAA